LAAPATADRARWAQRVHVALVELAGDFREHIDITEGPDGISRDLLKTSPRLSDAPASLTREHALISGQIDQLVARVTASDVTADVDRVRSLGTALLRRLVPHRQRRSALVFAARGASGPSPRTALLGRLVRHRQRGSDLVFDAYECDLGGET